MTGEVQTMSITRVTWRHLLLTGLDGRSGFRMKRPLNSTPPRPNIPLSNIDVKAAGAPSFSEDGNTWTSARAPDEYPDSGGNRFVRAFWFISGRDHDPMGTGQTTGQTLAGSPSVNVTHNGGLWALHVTAYYIWDFGRGGGAHIVAVDAFDQDALDVADVDLITGLPKGFVGDFIPDDFVDVDIDPPWRPAQADRDRNTARTDSVNETGVLNTT